MRLGLLSLLFLTGTCIIANGIIPLRILPSLPSNCEAPFIYFYGNEVDDISGSTITTDGNFLFVGGRQNEKVIISKLSLDGQPVWTRSLELGSFVSQIVDLKIDQEGMLIGCGQTNPSNSLVDISSFAFKMEPEGGDIIWSQVYTEANSLFFLAYDIVDRASTSPYVLLGNAQHNGSLNTGCDATFYSLDRETGTLVGSAQHISLGNCETFNAGLAIDGDIYATGRFNNSNIGFNRMRPAIVRMDSTGTTRWSKLYLESLDNNARIFSSHMAQDGHDHLIVAAHGDADNVSVFTNEAWLFRVNLMGETEWIQRYTYPDRVRSEEILSIPGGGYLFLASAPGLNRLFLSQLDPQGQVRWSRQIDNVSVTHPANELILIEDQVYLTTSMVNGDRQQMALFRFQIENGDLPTDCLATDSLVLGVTTIDTLSEADVELMYYPALPSPTNRMISGITDIAALPESCLPDCTFAETCGNGIDDDEDGLVDCDDPDLVDECCCYEPPLLELGPDQSNCTGDSISLSVDDVFSTVLWSTGDTTHTLDLTNTGSYTVSVTDRCANVQIDTIVLQINTPIETDELRQICAGDSLLLFGEYRRQAGLYSEHFTSTSGCDSTHTIELIVLGPIFTQERQTICAGDSLEIFGNYQNSSAVYQQSFSASTGCDSTHTVELNVLDPIQTQDTLVVQCAGRSISLFGQTIDSSGVYSASYTASTGCDSTHQVVVQFPEPIHTRDTIVRCTDEPVVILGQLRNIPGEYSATFSDRNGCDSTHTTTLMDETLQTSFNIFPNYPGSPPGFIVYVRTRGNGGPYQVSWEGRNYYDNTLQPVLPGEHIASIISANGCQYEAPFTVDDPRDNWWWGLQQAPSCKDPKGGSVVVANDLPGLSYSLDGVTYFSDPLIKDLAAGTYPIYLKYIDGQIVRDSLRIPAPALPEVKLPTDRRIVRGESTRIMPLSKNPMDYTYQWKSEHKLDCSDCPQVTVRPTQDTEYEVVVTDDQGCQGSARMKVWVEQPLPYYVPNIFSPNQDGLNDYFTLYAGPEVSEISSFEVFDQWGKQVFSTSHLAPGNDKDAWNGRYLNQTLPQGSYAYVFILKMADGSKLEVKGVVSLIK